MRRGARTVDDRGTGVADDVERFSATSGRVGGGLALVVLVVVAAAVLADDDPSYAGLALTVFFAALTWAALLRPRVELGSSELVLRNMLSTVRLPLAAISTVVVRQVLVVQAGGERHTCPAVGRKRRDLQRQARGHGGGGPRGLGGMLGMTPATPVSSGAASVGASGPGPETGSYGLLVEQRIQARVADARAVAGVADGSPEQAELAQRVERQPAWPEIAGLAVPLAVFVVLALT